MTQKKLPNDFDRIIRISKYANAYMKVFGTDTLSTCDDKEHFLNYKKPISYKFNSYGYRDTEWPDDLSDAYWCVGDSATLGIGQPFEETWPQVLEQKTGKRCINLGEAGCSNDTIRLRVEFIYKNYKPKNIFIMWSHLARRRVNDENVPYNKKDFGEQQDIRNFESNFNTANALPANIGNFIVPNPVVGDEKKLRQKYKNLIFLKYVDYARDSVHFAVNTSQLIYKVIQKKYVDKNMSIDKSSK